MENKSLAVIIPAYRSDYLAQTLDSFAAQTCKDFIVYVGDDASPSDIKSIVDSYSGKMDIRYTRFDENMGGKDLVGQWERCLNLAGSEDWIWLFSDDDVVEENCVKAFRDSVLPQNEDVLHFNLNIIDRSGRIIRHCPEFPEQMSAESFFYLLYKRQIVARMPEFVFRACKLRQFGFVNFDLAWRSDNATVMKYAFPKGIMTLVGENACVHWRQSTNNISSQGLEMNRKNDATLSFFNWVTSFFNEKGISNPMSHFYFMKTFVFLLEYRGCLKFLADCRKSAHQLNCVRWFEYPLFNLLAVYRLIYRKFER